MMIVNKVYLYLCLLIICSLGNGVSLKCSNTFLLNGQPEFCTGNTYYVGNRLVIGAWRQYKDITITPSAQADYSNGGISFVGLKLGVEYTVSGKSIEPGCEINPPVTEKYNFTSGIYISVEQAPCVATSGNLYVETSFSNSTVTIGLTANELTFLSGNLYHFEAPIGSYMNARISSGDLSYEYLTMYCLYDFSIAPLSNLRPHIQIIYGECSTLSAPSLVVLNYQKFTDLRLVSQNVAVDLHNNHSTQTDNLVAGVPSGGRFTDLIAGSDTLIATSNQCGEQQFNVDLNYNYPVMSFDFDPECPNAINVTARLESGNDEDGTWTWNSQTPISTFPYTLSREDYEFEFTWTANVGNCNVSRTFGLPSFQLPIRHEVISKELSCDESTITIMFIVFPGVTNFPLSSLVIYDLDAFEFIKPSSEGVYNIPFAHIIDVYSTDSCYNDYADSYQVFFPLPKPVIQVVNGDPLGLAFETVDLYIPNYLDFTELYITSQTTPPLLQIDQLLEHVEGVPSVNRIDHVEGKFTNVTRSYSLVYQFRNCSEPITESLDLTPYQQYSFRSPNIRITSNITQLPNCVDSVGQVTYEIYHSELGLLGTMTETFNAEWENMNNRMFYYPQGFVYIYFDWNVTQGLKYIQPNITISEYTSPPTCQYGNQMFSIQNNTIIQNIFINGVINNNLVFTIPVGSNNITVDFQEPKCLSQTFTLTVIHTEIFPLTYEVTPLSVCDGFGGITITEDDNNSSFALYDSADNFYPLPASQLVGGFYRLTVDNPECPNAKDQIGIIDIFVPSPNTITPQYKVIRGPSCQVSNTQYSDAVVEFSLLNSDGSTTNVENVQVGNIVYNTPIVTNLNPGENTVYLGSQNCKYRLDFYLESDTPDITYTDLGYLCDNSYDSGYSVQLISSNPNIEFSNVFAGYYSPVLYMNTGNVRGLLNRNDVLTVFWNNDNCFKEIELDLEPQALPTFTFVSTCGDYNGYIQINEPERFVTFSEGIGYSDEQGRIYNTMNFYQNTAFLDVQDLYTGCFIETYLSLQTWFNVAEITDEREDESCSGANDGEVTLEKDSTSNYVYYLHGSYIISQGPTPMILINGANVQRPTGPSIDFNSASNGTNFFTYLIPGATYTVIKTIPNNPLCQIFVDEELTVSNREPQFEVVSSNTCNIDVPSTLNVVLERVDNSTLSLTINDVTSQNGTFDNLEAGKLYDMKVSLMADTCKRSMTTALQVPQQSSSTAVECSDAITTEDKKSNTGLIVGLVLGILALIFGGIVGFLLYKRKRIAKPVKPELIPMSTVSIFQGGKVAKLDEF